MRHYVTELQRRKIHETCSSNIPEERVYTRLLKVSGKLHVGGINAIQAEKLAKVAKINNTVGIKFVYSNIQNSHENFENQFTQS